MLIIPNQAGRLSRNDLMDCLPRSCVPTGKRNCNLWVETLIAAAEHDDVYNEFENSDLLNEAGGPVNFKQTEFKLEFGERLMAMAETKSAYIALLISRHIQFVHGDDPKAKSFINKLKKQEKIWLKCSGSSREEISQAYELLEFCDAFSLLICRGLVQPEHRKLEISNGPDGTSYAMHASWDGIIVEPWPFENNSFAVSWESRTLSQLSFNSADEFRKAVVSAKVESHELKLSGGSQYTNYNKL